MDWSRSLRRRRPRQQKSRSFRADHLQSQVFEVRYGSRHHNSSYRRHDQTRPSAQGGARRRRMLLKEEAGKTLRAGYGGEERSNDADLHDNDAHAFFPFPCALDFLSS